MTDDLMAPVDSSRPDRHRRLHPAWIVAGVAFVALVAAAGFRAAPGVLIVPLETEFGWSRSTLSAAVSVNLVLFGLTAPFAAALMDRFGIRRVTVAALAVVAAGSGGTVWMSSAWQLVLCWGILIGLGTGSMALVFAATVAQRWFVARRGLVMGILTAGSATGQLVFLPLVAWLADSTGWRAASLTIAGAALAVIPLVLLVLRERPAELGVQPYGAVPGPVDQPAERPRAGAARAALDALRDAARTRAFWALAVGFAICGMSTNGLIGTHFIPAAHDHGMPQTTAAGLLVLVGIFDIVGTVASGWLTDRFDPRVLLAVYYLLRGASLAVLPALLAETVQPSVVVFVVFYGLDWVATVPPTVALCRAMFGDRGTIVFGWVFASHQLGAAAAATAAGLVRDITGEYTSAWLGAGALCAVAAVLSFRVPRRQPHAMQSVRL
ncbi:MAG TPA: MFS transporter [Jiangellaceae bacterium]